MRYRYKALSATGEILEGELEATSRALAIHALQDAGHLPVRAEPSQPRWTWWRRHAGRCGRREVAVLTRELEVMLQAGLALDRCLALLQQLANRPAVRYLAQRLHDQVQAGNPLSAALAEHPQAFDRFYISIVRAGEATGKLAEAMGRLAAYLERMIEIRTTVMSALIYPAILLFITVTSLLAMLVFLIPRFEPLFAASGSALPLLTQVVFGAAEMVRHHGLLLAVAAGLSYAPARMLLHNPTHRLRLHQLLLGLPLAGPLWQKLDIARMARTLGTLLTNGVPILQALDIAGTVLRNEELARQLERATDAVRRGGRLSTELARHRHFPALAAQLLQVGEESSQVETMLMHIANVYDAQSAAAIQNLLALLGPVLILLLGGLIGAGVIAVLLPILALNELVV